MEGLVRKEDGCLDAITAVEGSGVVVLSFIPDMDVNEIRDDLEDDAIGTASIHYVASERTEYCRKVTYRDIVLFAGEHGFTKVNRSGTLWQRMG